jgi:hypothetical protein
MVFDVSKPWVILVPGGAVFQQRAANEVAAHIAFLRQRSGMGEEAPHIVEGDKKEKDTPIIVLSCQDAGRGSPGFFWRIDKDRLDLHGDSLRGLWNAVFDFLAALGFRWPSPGRELIPEADDTPGLYPLSARGNYRSSISTLEERKRLLLGTQEMGRPWSAWEGLRAKILWGIQQGIDALIVPLGFFRERPLERLLGIKRRRIEDLQRMAEAYAFYIEEGGWELSRLVPRRYFLIRRDMFRMEGGERLSAYNFCPSNPKTLAVIRRESRRFFSIKSKTRVFHLWPDRNHASDWCSCPSCRAFSPTEQNRIAVAAAADVLEKIRYGAKLSYLENSDAEGDIKTRLNMFRITSLPLLIPS